MAVAATLVECHVAASHVAGWLWAARVGAVLIGTVPAIGAAAIGTVIGEIRTVDGVGGTVIGGVFPGTTSCSLAALAFRGGGAGAGVLGQAGAGAGAAAGVVTVTTATTLTTVAATAIPITAMAMDTEPSTSLHTVSLSTVSTETAANPESPSCSGGCHALDITMDPSTESLGRRLAAQSGITSKHTAT